MTISDNAKIVVHELMSEPDALPLISACAVAGNGWRENLMRPVTIGAKDHGSDGLLQWRGDRLDALKRWPNWQDLRVQCRFFKAECKARFPQLWAQITQPGKRTLGNLTANICDVYERPSAAGRVIDTRIKYAGEVMKLFDGTQPVAPPSVQVPANVPPELVRAIIAILNNALNGHLSSIGGMLSLVWAALIANHIPILGHMPSGDWMPWLVWGFTMIFGLGGTQAKQEVESPPPIYPSVEQPKQENIVNPEVIITLITALESFIPVVEKIVADIPKIQSDVAAIKSTLDTAGQVDPAATDRISQLIEKVNNLRVANGV